MKKLFFVFTAVYSMTRAHHPKTKKKNPVGNHKNPRKTNKMGFIHPKKHHPYVFLQIDSPPSGGNGPPFFSPPTKKSPQHNPITNTTNIILNTSIMKKEPPSHISLLRRKKVPGKRPARQQGRSRRGWGMEVW